MNEAASTASAQRPRALCVAAARALAGRPALAWRGDLLHDGRHPLPPFAPHLHPAPDADSPVTWRGAIDGCAWRLRCSDAGLHERLAPATPIARRLFDMLEQYRVEALVEATWPGVRHNVERRFDDWCAALEQARALETRRGLLLFAAARTCRARVFGRPLDERIAEGIEGARAELAAAVGPDLVALRRLREDQAAYAAPALRIAGWVADRLQHAEPDEDSAAADADPARMHAWAGLVGPLPDLPPATLPGDSPAEGGCTAVAAKPGHPDYRVYTRAYDRQADAAALVRAPVLAERRQELDALCAQAGLGVGRLAAAWADLLGAPRHDGWSGDEEEGQVDGRRLARLIASPLERSVFRRPAARPATDAVVAFVVDCSGSMRAHAPLVATLLDLMARALDLAGAGCEVLGFTTGAWNGGRAWRDWLRAGRPPQPGRVAERLHLVFKDGDTPWRRARRPIAALLHPELFREGLDGEALEWAADRLAMRPERRRLLVMVGDGCPMDTATRLANDPGLLERHFREACARVRDDGAVELAALSLGQDLGAEADRQRRIDPAAPEALRMTARAILELARDCRFAR